MHLFSWSIKNFKLNIRKKGAGLAVSIAGLLMKQEALVQASLTGKISLAIIRLLY